jgi:hypothetical protein
MPPPPPSGLDRRVIFQPAVLLSGFSSLQEFADASKFVGDIGGALFDSAGTVLAARPLLLAAAAPPGPSPASAAVDMTDVWTQESTAQAPASVALPRTGLGSSRGRSDEELLQGAALVVTGEQLASFRQWAQRRSQMPARAQAPRGRGR